VVEGQKQYVVDSPSGERLQGVKELFQWEVEYWTNLGYKLEEYVA
jgi:hypothetical protein